MLPVDYLHIFIDYDGMQVQVIIELHKRFYFIFLQVYEFPVLREKFEYAIIECSKYFTFHVVLYSTGLLSAA